MPSPRHFTVEYGGWQRDNSRIDVFQARFRVLADGEYFQFFTAGVPGIDVMAAERIEGVTLGTFRRAFADLAIDEIRQAIASGDAPRSDDPTMAIELRPDPEQARRLARTASGLDYAEGDVIAEFDM